MEKHINRSGERAKVIRYADDFVVLVNKEEELAKKMEAIKLFLRPRGLELNLEKTKIKHTDYEMNGGIGTNFLGF
jgi:RNA-directed DNA polymerase